MKKLLLLLALLLCVPWHTYAQSAGGVVVVPSRPSPIYWDMDLASCVNEVPSSIWNTWSGNAPTFECDTGSARITGHALFPDSDGEFAVQVARYLVPGWTSPLDARIVWWSTATTGDVVFRIYTKCYAVGDADDVAFNTASSVTSTAQGTASRLNVATLTGIDVTGCAAGKVMRIFFSRDRTDAADTIAAAVAVEKVIFTARMAY